MRDSRGRGARRSWSPSAAAMEAGLDGLMTAHIAVPDAHRRRAARHPLRPGAGRAAAPTARLRRAGDHRRAGDGRHRRALRGGPGRGAGGDRRRGHGARPLAGGEEGGGVRRRCSQRGAHRRALPGAAGRGGAPHPHRQGAPRAVRAAAPGGGATGQPARSEHAEVARRIARGAVTLLRTDGKHFPLSPGARLAVITAEAPWARPSSSASRTPRC